MGAGLKYGLHILMNFGNDAYTTYEIHQTK
jgi:hypothetical protein